MSTKIIFTIEKEIHNTLNYLDLTITNKHNQLTFSVYQKPTTTDLIIHNNYFQVHKELKNNADSQKTHLL
jgi:predicted HNH restriction endonuclease